MRETLNEHKSSIAIIAIAMLMMGLGLNIAIKDMTQQYQQETIQNSQQKGNILTGYVTYAVGNEDADYCEIIGVNE